MVVKNTFINEANFSKSVGPALPISLSKQQSARAAYKQATSHSIVPSKDRNLVVAKSSLERNRSTDTKKPATALGIIMLQIYLVESVILLAMSVAKSDQQNGQQYERAENITSSGLLNIFHGILDGILGSLQVALLARLGASGVEHFLGNRFVIAYDPSVQVLLA